MDLDRYFTDVSQFSADGLLVDWRWLIGDSFSVFRATAMGDMFLRDRDGRLHFLDMVGGELRAFADTEEQFHAKLLDRHVRKDVLLTFVVRDLHSAGLLLAPGQCYSPEQPPLLGGELSDENLKPCDFHVHASIMGQLHRQVKDLPPGTRISEVRLDE